MAIKKKTTSSSRAKKPAAKKTSKAAPKTKKKGGAPKKALRPTTRGAGPKKKKTAAATAAPAGPAENPAAHALARKIAETVLDKKALDVVILDVRGMTSYADYFVVASGESERQVSAMADSVTDKVKEEK